MAASSYLIKGGTIIDGSGFPMTKGDITISGETIKAISGEIKSSPTRVIDATGKYIIPGIIDITNHADTHWTLFASPSEESLLHQGITSIVGGLCGSSLAPISEARALRAIQKWTDISNININWRSQDEFYQELERHEFGVNFSSFVGHGTLRRGILGDNLRALNRDELESVKLLLKRSLDEGAMGLSIGLGTAHGGAVPQEELVELCRVVKDAGKLVSIHLRNEGRKLLSSVVEAVNIARASGVDVQIAHFKAIGKKAWHDLKKALTIIRRARDRENLSVWVDFFPYVRTGSLLYSFLPEWVREGGKEEIITRLKTSERRSEIIDAIRALTLHYDNIIVAEAQKDKKSVGKTIAQISKTSELPPEETLIELLIVNDLGITIFGKTLNGKNIVRIAKESFSIFGSDGIGESGALSRAKGDLTHPRSYGAAPRFLDRLVKRGSILTWEEAVKKMTHLPAERLGMGGHRGLIAKGYAADIVVLDPYEIRDTATYTNPYQYPNGIEYVFVNGRLAIDKGIFTQALAGKILRRA